MSDIPGGSFFKGIPWALSHKIFISWENKELQLLKSQYNLSGGSRFKVKTWEEEVIEEFIILISFLEMIELEIFYKYFLLKSALPN